MNDYKPELNPDEQDPFNGGGADDPAADLGVPREELADQLDGMERAANEDDGDDSIVVGEDDTEDKLDQTDERV